MYNIIIIFATIPNGTFGEAKKKINNMTFFSHFLPKKRIPYDKFITNRCHRNSQDYSQQIKYQHFKNKKIQENFFSDKWVV